MRHPPKYFCLTGKRERHYIDEHQARDMVSSLPCDGSSRPWQTVAIAVTVAVTVVVTVAVTVEVASL